MNSEPERVPARIANCHSHRARARFMLSLARKPQHKGYSRAHGGSYYITEDEAKTIRGTIKGVTIARETLQVHPAVLA